MKPTRYILIALLLVMAACKPKPVPVPKDDVFTFGQVTRYGAYYQEQGIENNVYMLDVYTSGLTLNDQEKIVGSGMNLCFSDVFTLPEDTKLQYGVTYKADSTGRADTFLPGQDFEGNINGAYLLDIRDSKVSSITLFKNGTFVMEQAGDTTHIIFELVTTEGRLYKAVFHAPLTYKRKL
ncbi:MAG: hypothetical protein E7074_02190 [Bacteroidales bacterium]|jgi:hypothetical protein|nr:hypothetical protein [Bacteroidales bacterium]MBQ7671933.1 hypothetical protein [Paludibacteraceae bacterium]